MPRRVPSASPKPPVLVDGDKVRRLRKERGLEVAELAAMIGCSRAHLANVELGHRRRVRAQTFERLCDALRVSQPWRLQDRTDAAEKQVA